MTGRTLRTILFATLYLMSSAACCLHAATSSASRGISIDGDASEWNIDELVYQDSSNDSPYGPLTDLANLYVTWDNTNLYMAITGTDQGAALVVYLSTGPGGITDASQIRNTSGGIDDPTFNWWWGAPLLFPSGFTPQFQWDSYGMRVDPNDPSHGFFHYEGNPVRGVKQATVQQALVQSVSPNAGAMEIQIPWTTLYGGIATPPGLPIGIPPAASIKILAVLKDGSGRGPRETVPREQGTLSNFTTTFFTVDTFLNVPVAYATGTPLFNISPVPRNFQAVAGPTQVSLSWNQRGGFEQYLAYYTVERSLNNFASVSNSFNTTSTSYLDTGLVNGTVYYYRVRAVYNLPNAGITPAQGASQIQSATPKGPSVTFSPLNQYAYQGQPLNLVATIPTPTGENLTSLRLFWRPAGASSFTNFSGTSSLSGNNYSFTITSDNVNTPGLDYYIDARSNSGITLVPSGAPGSFFTVQVAGSVTQTAGVSNDTTITLPGSQGSGGASTTLFIPAFSLAAPTPILAQLKSFGDIVADNEALTAPTAVISNPEPAEIYDFFALDAGGNKISVPFLKKATLTLAYFPSDVASLGLDSSRLRIYRWTGTNWILLGGSVNFQNNTVTAQTDHLSRYAIFETQPSALAPAPTSSLTQVVRSSFFPHLGEALEFVFDTVPPDLQLNIYTAKGAPVRSMTGGKIWDGRDDSGSFVESGLYIYQLQFGGKRISGSCVVVR